MNDFDAQYVTYDEQVAVDRMMGKLKDYDNADMVARFIMKYADHPVKITKSIKQMTRNLGYISMSLFMIDTKLCEDLGTYWNKHFTDFPKLYYLLWDKTNHLVWSSDSGSYGFIQNPYDFIRRILSDKDALQSLNVTDEEVTLLKSAMAKLPKEYQFSSEKEEMREWISSFRESMELLGISPSLSDRKKELMNTYAKEVHMPEVIFDLVCEIKALRDALAKVYGVKPSYFTGPTTLHESLGMKYKGKSVDTVRGMKKLIE